MRYSSQNSRRSMERGFTTIAAMALVATLIGISVAFMSWATDEAYQARTTSAAMEAYYAAQTGIIEEGFTWLRTQQAGLLPQGEQNLGRGSVIVNGEEIAKYEEVKIRPVFGSQSDADIFGRRDLFRISAIGKVEIPWMDFERHRKVMKTVIRKAVLYVSVRSFADYMYLTDHERLANGDIIRFYGDDTLWGRTHSNDTIHIMQNPVFYDIVSSSAPAFGRGIGFSPEFRGPDPYFNVAEVLIPDTGWTVREGAHQQGNFYGMADMEYRVSFRGASARIWEWEEGTPFDSLSAQTHTYNVSAAGGDGTCIFIDGPVTLYGVVTGPWTLGSSRDIFLIDDIRYTCLNQNTHEVPFECGDYLGIVSEGRVVIANTWANGRENMAAGANIQINAAIVALGESFTFDQQNETWDLYQGPNPDERGQIFLTGSVTQRRRGYVHRSNHGGTGYDKAYRYDERFLRRRPPCFFDATDNSGRALFNIVQWGQAVEKQTDVNANPTKRVLYN